ncbi:Kinesin-like protein kif23, partial [Branchiostoma belcheri]
MKPTRGKTPKKTPRRPQQTNKAKDPVEVYCRLRPPSDDQTDLCAEVLSDGVLLLRPSEAARVNRIGELKETQHTFRFVFPPETSQKTLFDMVALPLVQDVIQGKNGLLFTYGVTGSGKTHTVQGTPADHGLLPRCLDVIFNSIGELQAKRYVFKPDKVNGMDLQTEADAMLERQRKLQQDLLVPPKTPTTPRSPPASQISLRPSGDPTRGQAGTSGDTEYPVLNAGDDWQNFPYVADPTKVEAVDEDNAYAVFVSFIEIYNNYIYDLLEEAPTSAPSTPRAPQSKILREDLNHNMYVYGATEVEVKNPEEACEQLIKGQKRRRVAHTQLNMASSRSHSVFLIRVAQAPLDPEGEEVLQDKAQVCVSQLALVDLAGSERTNRTKNTGDRLREASNINASLMVLRTCIEVLRENQTTNSNRIVPYRDSKVTHLFKNYFEGEGKVRMVICVNPSASDYEETIVSTQDINLQLTQEVEITRQKEVRFDTGLAAGRRRANQMYKEALEKFERGEQDVHFALPGRPGYTLGPPWPCLELTAASDDMTLQNLIQFLVDREACRRTLCEDLSRKHEVMRTQLLDLEKNNIVLRQEMESLQEQLSGKGKDLERAKKKIENLEYKNEVLRRTAQLYDEEKKEMESETVTQSRVTCRHFASLIGCCGRCWQRSGRLERADARLKSKDHQITSRTAESRRLRQTMKAIEQTKDAKWEKECVSIGLTVGRIARRPEGDPTSRRAGTEGDVECP